jgi:hypothetical protein
VEPTKLAGGAVEFLRGFPLTIRLLVATLVLVAAVVALYGYYGWPHWPIRHSPVLNVIGLLSLATAVFVLISYSPRPAMSVADLPEKKPVFAEALRYFKTGPELVGPRRELVKSMHNAYETAPAANPYLLAPGEMKECQVSLWDFDRIAFYLYERYTTATAAADRVQRVRYELLLLGNPRWTRSLAPLHYAVESVHAALFEQPSAPALSPSELKPFRRILEVLDSWPAKLMRAISRQEPPGIVTNCRQILAKGPAGAECSAEISRTA